MAVVKINEVGFNKFTGEIGGIEFVNGISVEDLSKSDVQRMGASMRIEEVLHEDEGGVVTGNQLGVAADLAKGVDVSAKVQKKVTIVEEPIVKEELIVDDSIVDEDGNEYTVKSVEEIADKGGINAVREVAKKFGVKGNSIAGIIKLIAKEIEK